MKLLEKIDERCETMASNGILFKNIELIYPKDESRIKTELDLKMFPALILNNGEIVYKYSPILNKIGALVGAVNDKINYGDDDLNSRAEFRRFARNHLNENTKDNFDTSAAIADKFEQFNNRRGIKLENAGPPRRSLFGGNNNNMAKQSPLMDDDFDFDDDDFTEFNEPTGRDTNPASISKKIYSRDETTYWENQEET